MVLRKDNVSHDETIIEDNDWLRKKDIAFHHAKHAQWMDRLNDERDKMSRTISPLITDWGNILTSMFQKWGGTQIERGIRQKWYSVMQHEIVKS